MNRSITLQHLVKAVWYSETSPEHFSNGLFLSPIQLSKFQNQCLFHDYPVLIFSFPMLNRALGSCRYPVSLNHSPSSSTSCLLLPSSVSHRCIGVSCCGCSRCRLAGRLWSSALWRRAGSRRCRSRSPVCRRSNQQRAHLRSLARWAHRMTQLQTVKGQLTTHVYVQYKPHAREICGATPDKHRDCRQAHIHWPVTFL